MLLVPVTQIRPNPHQPRSRFDTDALAELAASIREHGIIQPLIVTHAPDVADGYWLIAGERRWRAARHVNLQDVPVIVREATSQQLMEWALVENVQRADLNAFEEATAYHTMMQEFGMTQAQVADRVGKSRSAVANTVRLLQLPTSVQEAVIEERVTAGHARALLALENDEEMIQYLGLIEGQKLSVRQTEELVKNRAMADQRVDTALAKETDKSEYIQATQDAHLHALENRFRSSLGTKVNLSRNADGTGRLVIHFFSDDDLDHLLQRMIGDEEL